ncbi:hypothetical protein [Salinilacihabitans rarus]|nr:hypothetical protein [Salinilacihabitans rarus]
MALDRAQFEHPSWLTAAGTGVGYLLILLLLFVALFVLPYLAFATLGAP